MAKAKKEKMEANPFKLKKELPRLPGYIIVTLWTAFIFCMIGWIILASLSTTKEIFTGSLLASGLHFENYTKALFTNKAALNLLNSVIYTVPSCILIIVVCAPAAYCMSRFKFRGAGLIQALIIIGLAIPNIMIVMPLFSIVSALNLSGTHFTLIFLYTACSVPYTTFFLLTFFKGRFSHAGRANDKGVQAVLRVQNRRLGKLDHRFQTALTARQHLEAGGFLLHCMRQIARSIADRPPRQLFQFSFLHQFIQQRADIGTLHLHLFGNFLCSRTCLPFVRHRGDQPLHASQHFLFFGHTLLHSDSSLCINVYNRRITISQ